VTNAEAAREAAIRRADGEKQARSSKVRASVEDQGGHAR